MHGGRLLQVTHVWYQAAPRFDFAQIIADLGNAILAVQSHSPTISWDRSDVALLATKDALIIVGCQQNLTGRYGTCFSIAIGQSPDFGAGQLDPAHQTVLSQAAFDTLQDRATSDRHQFFECNDTFEVGLIDRLMVAAANQTINRPSSIDETRDAATPETARLEPMGSLDMGSIMQRLSSDLKTGTSGLISRAIASATVQAQRRLVPSAQVASGGKTGQTKSTLLFRKSSGQSDPSTKQNSNDTTRQNPRSESELLALRRALYGADPTRVSGAGRIGVKTKQAIEQLVVFRYVLSGRLGERAKAKPLPANEDGANI